RLPVDDAEAVRLERRGVGVAATELLPLVHELPDDLLDHVDREDVLTSHCSLAHRRIRPARASRDARATVLTLRFICSDCPRTPTRATGRTGGFYSASADSGAAPIQSRACLAASCSAAFFERPVPVPARSSSITAAHVKRRSCGGPSTSSTVYVTWRPRRASASCSSVLWSTWLVSAYSIRSANAATIAASIFAKPCSRKSAASAA